MLLYGPPGVGKFEYCLSLTKDWLTAGESVLYITTEREPGEIKGQGKKAGIVLDNYEDKTLTFIDCYSWSVGKKYEKGFSIENPANINEINLVIEKAAEELKKPARLVFDSLSPLFLYNNPDIMTRFFQSLTSKAKTQYGFVIYTLQEGVHDPRTVNTLVYLVDGHLQMKFEEEDTLERKFRVHHLKGLPADPAWRTFKINGGFKFE